MDGRAARRLGAPMAILWAGSLGLMAEATAQTAPPDAMVLAPRADAPAGTLHAHGAAGFLGGMPLSAHIASIAADAAALDRAHAYFVSLSALPIDLDDVGVDVAPHGVLTQHTQSYGGVPIEGTFASALLRGSTLVFARHLFVVPPTDLDPSPTLGADAAVSLAQGGAATILQGIEQVGSPTLTVAYFADTPHLCWRVELRAEAPAAVHAAYVDAHSGAFLGTLRASAGGAVGTLAASVDATCQGGASAEVPLPFVAVGGTQSDAAGAFATAAGPLNVRLVSPYAALHDSAAALSGPFAFTLQPAPAVNTLAVTGASILQLDAFRNVMRMRAWVLGHEVLSGTQRAWGGQQLTVNLNLSAHCNAYYVPSENSVNFFSAGQGCANTGTIPIVVHHECGHGVQYNSGNGGNFDGQVAEGLADTAAIFADRADFLPGIAPGCAGQLRTCVNSYSFCGSGCTFSANTEIHTGGQALCGAWRELRAGMIVRYGAELGTATASALYLKYLTMISGNMQDTYQAAIAADEDDDSNPGNGTRHSCEINQAFYGPTPHFPALAGSVVPSAPSLAIAHTPPGVVGADAPLRLEFALTPHPTCDPHPQLTAVVHYQVGADSTVRTAALSVAAGTYAATLGDVTAPATVRYWMDATLDGAGFRYPYQGAAAAQAAPVPAIAQMLRYADDAAIVGFDFDGDAGGAVRGTDAADGRSDWEWGVPAGLGGDPLTAQSGDKAWGLNLLAAGDTTGRPARTSTLALAPVAVPAGAEVRLQFWQAMLNPGAWQVVVNGTTVASDAGVSGGGTAVRRDPGWLFSDVDITAALAGGVAANVSFVAPPAAAGGVPLRLWAIDAVRLVSVPAAAVPAAQSTVAADAGDLQVRAETLGCAAAGADLGAWCGAGVALWALCRSSRRRAAVGFIVPNHPRSL